MSKEVFSGLVLDIKTNPKNDNQTIISVQTGKNSETGRAIVEDCFVKTSMVSRIRTAINEATNQEEQVSVVAIKKDDFVTIAVNTHNEGNIYEREVKKGETYLNESGVETKAEKDGVVKHMARSNGFNVMSIQKTSFEAVHQAQQLWG